jgi:hypothetical protein
VVPWLLGFIPVWILGVVDYHVEDGAGCDVREASPPESPQHLPRRSGRLQDASHEDTRVDDSAEIVTRHGRLAAALAPAFSPHFAHGFHDLARQFLIVDGKIDLIQEFRLFQHPQPAGTCQCLLRPCFATSSAGQLSERADENIAPSQNLFCALGKLPSQTRVTRFLDTS